MREIQERRAQAANWREYLRESGKGIAVYVWVWNEVLGSETRTWIKKSLAWITLLTIFATTESLLIRGIIDGAVARRTQFVVALLLGLVLFKLCRIGCTYYYSYCREYLEDLAQGHVDQRLSEMFFEKSLGQHIGDSTKLSMANLERARGRIHDVKNVVLDGVPGIIDLLISYTLLWTISAAGGVIIFFLFVGEIAISLYRNRVIVNAAAEVEEKGRAFNRYRTERWEMVERVKTCGKEKSEISAMQRLFLEYLDADMVLSVWRIRSGTIRGLIFSVIVNVIFAHGVWRFLHGDITIGVLYPLYSWLNNVSSNMWRFGELERSIGRRFPTIKAAMDILIAPPAVVEAADAVPIAMHEPLCIEFSGISHRYEHDTNGDTMPSVLADVDFTIAPGEKVALIGPSGAGKTTLARLVQRYMDPEKGSIRVNGFDLRNIAIQSWRDAVGYIPQQSQILDGTLKYNLLYALSDEDRAKVSDEDLWALMRALRIDFGPRLTHGLETLVGRRGIKLSGGEAQRLMVGSAVLKRARFLVIDEATSSLDSTTERQVQAGLELTIPKSTSALVIAHRLSTIRRLCDKFVVLCPGDNGTSHIEAVARSFEELHRVSPTFRSIAADQGLVIGQERRIRDLHG